jgi:hypothetical protein
MTPEADHELLHDEQKRLVPFSLLADDQRETHRHVYLNRPAIKATTVIPFPQPLPEPPRAA